MRKNLGFQPSGAKELGYGRAVHHLLRRVAEHARGFGDLPDASDLDRLFDREFYLPYADRPAWEAMEARARSLVEGYLRDFPDDLHRVWEVERPFELHLHEANVSGRADVILDREDGVVGGLAIVDYKTRRVAADDANLELQLKAYTAAAQGEGFDVRAGYLHDLTASKGHARHKVDTAPQPVHEATVTLDSLAKRVRSREFQPTPGAHCKACDVRPLCRHAQKPSEKD
jgi:DNA helicase-2/ATP-dependent DNA helicase PcrA